MKRSLAALCFFVFCALSLSAYAAEEEVLPVPFTPQAPDANWSEPWQNACEETSIIMVDNFYEGDEISRAEARKEILEILRTKEKEFSFSQDESLQRILEIVNAADLGWTGKILEDPKIEDLITELEAKRPIIVPVYAPLLNNPFYGPEGPDYHVFVLVGFDEATKEFVIHDPGTRKGEDLRFSYDTILNAIHDFHPENYTSGRKAVLLTIPGKRTWSFLKTAPNQEVSNSRKRFIFPGIVALAGISGAIWYHSRKK